MVAGPDAQRQIAEAAVDAVQAVVASGDVLVIEDDPSAVRLLREYLEVAGYPVRVAATGRERPRLGRRAQAGGDHPRRPPARASTAGRCCAGSRPTTRTRDIPVIIVTVVEEREIGLALGAADYLVKPIHREALLTCLARYVATVADAGQPRRVLVVDDEAAALALIRAALEPEGYEVVTAQGGRAALEWARGGQIVDLVVCDLMMPEIDGFEVIAALKRDRRTAMVPIVVCTAHDLTVGAEGATQRADPRDRGQGSGRAARPARLAEPIGADAAQLMASERVMLVVEDEEPNRALLRAVLARASDQRLGGIVLIEAGDLASARRSSSSATSTSSCSTSGCPTATA